MLYESDDAGTSSPHPTPSELAARIPWHEIPMPTGPLAPAAAYYTWVDATEAIEHDPEHARCPHRTYLPLALKFAGPDAVVITVWSDQPHCLIREMVDRGCCCLGLSWLGDVVARLEAPRWVKDLPW